MNSSTFKDAPPIKHPSTFFKATISEELDDFTDPPYSTLNVLNLLSIVLIKSCTSSISSRVGVKPVPIAQIGSYAIIVFLEFEMFGTLSLICLIRTSFV